MSVFLPLFEQLRDAGFLKSVGARLYTLALDGEELHAHEPAPFIDPWPGNPEYARVLQQGGVVDAMGATHQVSLEHVTARDGEVTESPAFALIQSFAVLRDLRALGGDAARATARALIAHWLSAHGRWSAGAWHPDVTALRLYHWLASYHWLGLGVEEDLAVDMQHAMVRQLAHLERTTDPDVGVLIGLMAGHALLQQDKDAVQQDMEQLDARVATLVYPDGMVRSRSPFDLYTLLMHLVTARMLAGKVGLGLSARLSHAITQGAAALRFFILPDGQLAQLQGTRESDALAAETLLQLAGQKTAYRTARPNMALDGAGFRQVQQNRTWLLVDAGYIQGGHHSPAAFEFGAGKFRIVTQCGTLRTDASWREIMRSTAAHSTLTCNDRSVFETAQDAVITSDTGLKAEGIDVSLTHNGYDAAYGLTHRRHWFLSKDGRCLQGQDTLTRNAASSGLADKLPFAIRFHLHPTVQASVVREGASILLKLPNGQGWMFTHTGGQLTLEDSIYVGSGAKPRKTLQIVVSGTTDTTGAVIGWRFEAA